MFAARPLARHAFAPVLRTAAAVPRTHALARTIATAPHLLDVTHEIKLDHDNVRDLFARFKQATARDQKAMIANTLIREMAIHSDAEEVSVYNAYGDHGLGDTAAHNRDEHAEVKKRVYDADATVVTHPDYDAIMAKAVNAFLSHAEEEENDQLPVLRSKVSAEVNDKLARDFLEARTKAPKRPHPWAPQTGGIAQKAAAAQGRVHDSVIEVLGGREYVELKYEHPKQF